MDPIVGRSAGRPTLFEMLESRQMLSVSTPLVPKLTPADLTGLTPAQLARRARAVASLEGVYTGRLTLHATAGQPVIRDPATLTITSTSTDGLFSGTLAVTNLNTFTVQGSAIGRSMVFVLSTSNGGAGNVIGRLNANNRSIGGNYVARVAGQFTRGLLQVVKPLSTTALSASNTSLNAFNSNPNTSSTTGLALSTSNNTFIASANPVLQSSMVNTGLGPTGFTGVTTLAGPTGFTGVTPLAGPTGFTGLAGSLAASNAILGVTTPGFSLTTNPTFNTGATIDFGLAPLF